MADQPGQPDSPTRPAPLNLEGTLFDDLPAEQRPGATPEGIGYRGPTACAAAGITYRQLDYWARTGLVEPSVREASGSGRLGNCRESGAGQQPGNSGMPYATGEDAADPNLWCCASHSPWNTLQRRTRHERRRTNEVNARTFSRHV